MDYNPEVYNAGAADVVGPIHQLISILQQHFASHAASLEVEVGENG